MSLNIFVVTTSAPCKQRLENLKSTLECLKPLNATVHHVTEFDSDAIKLDEWQKKVDVQTKLNDPVFDQFLKPFTPQQLGNFLKHQKVWQTIANGANGANGADDDVNLVIEDDAAIHPLSLTLLSKLVSAFQAKKFKWDIVMTGLPMIRDMKLDITGMLTPVAPQGSQQVQMDDPNLALELRKVVVDYRVLPSKESYFICKSGAKALLTDTIRFKTNLHISYQIQKCGILAFYTSKNVFIDGSKSGRCSSITNPNNVLSYNAPYITVVELLQKPVLTMDDVATISMNLVELERRCPRHCDAIHQKAMFYFKQDKLGLAQRFLLDAFDYAVEQSALLNYHSDLLNNAINIHKLTQTLPARKARVTPVTPVTGFEQLYISKPQYKEMPSTLEALYAL